jgi:hypothetical protein
VVVLGLQRPASRRDQAQRVSDVDTGVVGRQTSVCGCSGIAESIRVRQSSVLGRKCHVLARLRFHLFDLAQAES